MESHRPLPSWAFGIVLVALLAGGCSKDEPSLARHAPMSKSENVAPPKAPSSSTKDGAKTQDKTQDGARKRSRALEVRASVEANVESPRDIERTARRLAELARDKGGFVSSLSLGDTEHEARITLRIPTTEIAAVRAVLSGGGGGGGGGGSVMRESETATDVTDAIADIDARVAQARIEETRLLELLAHRTGNLVDVLAVERALADVRERVERFEAEQRTAHGRVDLATVDVILRAGHALPAEPSLAEQLSSAAHDGVRIVKGAALLVTTTALRLGPILLLLLATFAGVAFSIRRLARRLA